MTILFYLKPNNSVSGEIKNKINKNSLMGNQLKIFVLCSLTMTVTSSSAQNIKRFNDTKGYLLCHCILKEYNIIDNSSQNAYNKDYSGSYFMQMTDLPIQILDSLEVYYKKSINKYRGNPQENSFDANANMASYTCWNFYEAKETDKYIKKLIRRK